MSWCFAIINNRLAEIFFEKGKTGAKITGHCYVQKVEYKMKREQKWIKEDTARLRFSYRNCRYKRLNIPI